MGTGSQQLRNFTHRLDRLDWADTRLYDEIADVMMTSTEERMDKALDPNGNPHRPLTEKYLAWKKKHNYLLPIWKRTGDSRNSVTATISRMITIQIKTSYAFFANKMRRVLGVSKADREQVAKTIDKFARKILRGR